MKYSLFWFPREVLTNRKTHRNFSFLFKRRR